MQMFGHAVADSGGHPAKDFGRPANPVFAFEELKQLLLRVPGCGTPHAFGQGGRSVSRDNAQTQFQRRERCLFVVAGLAERFVRKTDEWNLAEHRADAIAIVGLLVLAAVLLPIVLDLLGHLAGGVGFEPIVDHFQNVASEFAKSVLDGVLELPRGFWCDRLQQERLHELVDLLLLRLSDDSRLFTNSQHILSNQTYQKSENRLRSCIEASFPEYVFV